MAQRSSVRQLRHEVRRSAEEAAHSEVTERAGPPAGAPDFRPPSRRLATEPSSEPAVGRRSRRAEPEERAEPEVLPRTPSLGELLKEIMEERARGRARYGVEDAPWARRPAEPRRPGFHLVGCLVRIVGLVFLLIAAAIIFLFLLFGGFIFN